MGKITQASLKEKMSYNPETGFFRWKVPNVNKVSIGDIVGCVCKTKGYRVIRIDGKLYPAARLVWLYMEGYLPEYEMDHINNIRDDDRFNNLRHVSHGCNMRNIKTRKDSKSRITGVCWDKFRGKWFAYIGAGKKQVHLGRFLNKKDAVWARWEAEKQYDVSGCKSISDAQKYLFGAE